ncbi:MAG: rod shape-determining protein MreD [Ethanoligenens sp.]
MHIFYRKNTWKWLAYAITLLVVAALQTTPHLFPTISNIRPVLLIPLVIVVAMREGAGPGGVFGVLAGLLWDISGGAPFGFHGFFLMAIGILAALLVSEIFHASLFSALLFGFGFEFLMELISWFFLDYMTGGQDFVYALISVILPTAIYSFAFVIPFYFWAKYLNLRLTE